MHILVWWLNHHGQVQQKQARKGLHPKPIGKYNTDANECPVTYRGSDYFVPAGTPVLFSTKRAKRIYQGNDSYHFPINIHLHYLLCKISGAENI